MTEKTTPDLLPCQCGKNPSVKTGKTNDGTKSFRTDCVSCICGMNTGYHPIKPYPIAKRIWNTRTAPPAVDKTGVRSSLSTLIKYAEWQMSEGANYHPTLPSAVAMAKEALSSVEPQADPCTGHCLTDNLITVPNGCNCGTDTPQLPPAPDDGPCPQGMTCSGNGMDCVGDDLCKPTIPPRELVQMMVEALEWSGTMIKFSVDPGRCVTRDDKLKSAIKLYEEIQEALAAFEEWESGE